MDDWRFVIQFRGLFPGLKQVEGLFDHETPSPVPQLQNVLYNSILPCAFMS
jgi:hypothetical protein